MAIIVIWLLRTVQSKCLHLFKSMNSLWLLFMFMSKAFFYANKTVLSLCWKLTQSTRIVSMFSNFSGINLISLF